MSGKRAFLELLKQEGVEVLFGNPGTTELPLMDALAVDNELRYVLGLQEAAVMAMADGDAQAVIADLRQALRAHDIRRTASVGCENRQDGLSRPLRDRAAGDEADHLGERGRLDGERARVLSALVHERLRGPHHPVRGDLRRDARGGAALRHRLEVVGARAGLREHARVVGRERVDRLEASPARARQLRHRPARRFHVGR